MGPRYEADTREVPLIQMLPHSQVLLAVAQGAFILSPEWVTASLEAGRWLPEAAFASKVSPGRSVVCRQHEQ